jgi:hypothetical protein
VACSARPRRAARSSGAAYASASRVLKPCARARVDALLGFGAQRGDLPRVVLVGARRERDRGAVDDDARVQHAALLGRW